MAREYSFEDLDIWKLGMALAECAYKVTSRFPDSERFCLVAQMRRAAVSIPCNIAEGWGRGRGSAQSNFIRIARGSLHELRTQIELASRLGFVAEADCDDIKAQANVLGRKLHGYLSSLEGSAVQEHTSRYAVRVDPTSDEPTLPEAEVYSSSADL